MMCTEIRPFLIVVLLICLASKTSSQEPATKYTTRELIEKIIESENEIKDVQADYIRFEANTNVPLIYAHWAYQTNNELLAGLRFSKAGSDLGYSISIKSIYVMNEKKRYQDFRENLQRKYAYSNIRSPNSTDFHIFTALMAPSSLLGFGFVPRAFLGQVLQEAEKVEIKRTEQVDGHNCVVLESFGIKAPGSSLDNSYDIRVWIDMERDFRPLVIEKYSYSSVAEYKPKPFENLRQRLYDIKLRNIDGIWFPVEGTYDSFSSELVLPPEFEGLTKEQIPQKFTEQEFNKLIQKSKIKPVNSTPSRKALVDIDSIRINQGIEPEKFIIELPIGCEVFDKIENKEYTVEDSNTADVKFEVSYLKLNSFAPPELMKVIYPDTLIGCNLHDLDQFQNNLKQYEIEGRPLLLFLWDFNQRPSRAKIIELVDKSKNLEKRGLVIIVVQTSQIDEDELRQWTAANGISFPVIIKQTDELHTQLSIAARSLPWLILTDKNHFVQAEGFGIDNLDEVIMNSK